MEIDLYMIWFHVQRSTCRHENHQHATVNLRANWKGKLTLTGKQPFEQGGPLYFIVPVTRISCFQKKKKIEIISDPF